MAALREATATSLNASGTSHGRQLVFLALRLAEDAWQAGLQVLDPILAYDLSLTLVSVGNETFRPGVLSTSERRLTDESDDAPDRSTYFHAAELWLQRAWDSGPTTATERMADMRSAVASLLFEFSRRAENVSVGSPARRSLAEMIECMSATRDVHSANEITDISETDLRSLTDELRRGLAWVEHSTTIPDDSDDRTYGAVVRGVGISLSAKLAQCVQHGSSEQQQILEKGLQWADSCWRVRDCTAPATSVLCRDALVLVLLLWCERCRKNAKQCYDLCLKWARRLGRVEKEESSLSVIFELRAHCTYWDDVRQKRYVLISSIWKDVFAAVQQIRNHIAKNNRYGHSSLIHSVFISLLGLAADALHVENLPNRWQLVDMIFEIAAPSRLEPVLMVGFVQEFARRVLVPSMAQLDMTCVNRDLPQLEDEARKGYWRMQALYRAHWNGQDVETDLRTQAIRSLAIGHIATSPNVASTTDDATQVLRDRVAVSLSILFTLPFAFACLRPSPFRVYISAAIRVVVQRSLGEAWALRADHDFSTNAVMELATRAANVNDLSLKLTLAVSPQSTWMSTLGSVSLTKLRECFAEGKMTHDIVQLLDSGDLVLRMIVHPDYSVEFEKMPRQYILAESESLALAIESRKDDEALRALRALGAILFAGVRADRFSVFPNGSTYNAALGAAWTYVRDHSRNGVDQAVSPNVYLQLVQRRLDMEQNHCSCDKGDVNVLIILSEELRSYVSIANDIAPRCSSFGKVWLYRSRLRRVGGAKEPLVSVSEYSRGCVRPLGANQLNPDVIVWLTHGQFAEGWEDAISRYEMHTTETDNPAAIRWDEDGQWVRLPLSDGASLRVGLDKVALVVSGACSAARVSDVLSEDGLGLLRGFLLAGVPTIIAPAWPVNMTMSHRQQTFTLWHNFFSELIRSSEPLSELVADTHTSTSDAHFLDGSYLTVHGYGWAKSPWELRRRIVHGSSKR